MATVEVDRFELPVDDPIFLDTMTGIEFKFEFLVPLVILIARREDFDNELRGNGEMACLIGAVLEAIVAHPYHVGDDSIGGCEDDTRGLEGLA